MDRDNRPIEYRYLNMDTKAFAASQSALADQLKGKSSRLVAIPSHGFGQVLIAGGSKPFTEMGAILLCKKLAKAE